MSDPPISVVPVEARSFQGEAAGLVTRLAAGAVDGVCVAATLLAAYVGLNGLLFLLDPRGFELRGASVLASLATASALMVLYLTAAWALTGRTYGAHVLGLRVVGRRGGRVRPVVALLRAVFCVAFPVGVLWCAVSRERRSVQDVVLRTSVRYDWRPRRSTGRSEPLSPARS